MDRGRHGKNTTYKEKEPIDYFTVAYISLLSREPKKKAILWRVLLPYLSGYKTGVLFL